MTVAHEALMVGQPINLSGGGGSNPSRALYWQRVNRRDRHAIALADRHYSRTVVGAPQVGGNARLLILLKMPEADALWISSWDIFPRKHAWPDAWQCTIFRNESSVLSSTLIEEAVAVTRYIWPDAPAGGFVTFVNAELVRHKRDPGRCFRKAGWAIAGKTLGGLITLTLARDALPPPKLPIGELAL